MPTLANSSFPAPPRESGMVVRIGPDGVEKVPSPMLADSVSRAASFNLGPSFRHYQSIATLFLGFLVSLKLETLSEQGSQHVRDLVPRSAFRDDRLDVPAVRSKKIQVHHLV
jgi:hypothetical protein